jgi:hypothetical protein
MKSSLRQTTRSWARSVAGAVAGLVLTALPASADLVLEGPEIQLHVTTVHDQLDPKVVANGPGGGFLAAWVHVRGDGGELRDIFFRRFDADGMPLTGEIPGTVVSDRQSSSIVTMEANASGQFVIVITTQVTCCDFPNIAAYRRFDATGTVEEASGSLRAASLTDTGVASAAIAADGSALFGWYHPILSGAMNRGDYLTSLDSAGTQGPNDKLTSMEVGAFVAPVPGGGYFLLLGREAGWLDADGTPTGPLTPVPLTVDGFVTDLRVFVQPSGVALIVWGVWDVVADMSRLFARRVAQDGSLIGPEVPLLETPETWFINADAAMLPNGQFVVTWDAAQVNGGTKDIYVRQFRADGFPLSPVELVNRSNAGNEREPNIAALSTDSVVVVWENVDGQDGDEGGVYGQRLRVLPTPFFADGFESGDTGAWSFTRP